MKNHERKPKLDVFLKILERSSLEMKERILIMKIKTDFLHVLGH